MEEQGFYICSKCFKKNNGTNIFGKICKFCEAWTPPEKEMPMITENRAKLKMAQQQILQYLRNRK